MHIWGEGGEGERRGGREGGEEEREGREELGRGNEGGKRERKEEGEGGEEVERGKGRRKGEEERGGGRYLLLQCEDCKADVGYNLCLPTMHSSPLLEVDHSFGELNGHITKVLKKQD